MKSFLLTLFFMVIGMYVFAQDLPASSGKPIIDSNAIIHWLKLGSNRAISNDGNFFMYNVENLPSGSGTLVVQRTDNSWKRSFIGADHGFFSANSGQFIFQSKDTLYILQLGNDELHFITSVTSFQYAHTGKEEWLAYQLNNGQKEVVLSDLITGKNTHFDSVTNYLLGLNGKALVLQSLDASAKQSLKWLDLSQGQTKTIWEDESLPGSTTVLNGLQFDTSCSRLAFTVQHSSGSTSNGNRGIEISIWYFKMGMYEAIEEVSDKSPGIDKGLSVNNEMPTFSANGHYLFFYVRSTPDNRKPDPNVAQVSIWDYRDSVLQFEQRDDESSFCTCLDIQTGHFVRLQQEDERIATVSNDFAIIEDKKSINDYWWPSFPRKSVWLVSLRDGTRKLLPGALIYEFSPDSHYLVYYDYKRQHYYSYDLTSNKIANISGSIPVSYITEGDPHVDLPTNPRAPLGIAGWLPNDGGVLIFGEYDMWRLSLSGYRSPENVTNGYGRLHHIKFRLITVDSKGNDAPGRTTILMTAFNTLNKYNGIFLMTLGGKEDPELLTMGPWTLYHGSPNVVGEGEYSLDQMVPLKARDENTWIVRRETGTDAPNYFLTTDLKKYQPLTDLQPQKAYNWLQPELVTWTQLDGTPSQGILYKPENFDPRKKYPVIFEYYEEWSHNMYEYPTPKFAIGRINIPWYVSRGYLVFTPDIFFSVANKSGKLVGDCAVNAVVSAARYLSNLPYVDSKRLGIQGHSFGGGETLYIITHTNIFAAACAASSTVSNEISAYLGILRANGKLVLSKMDHPEIGHNKIGATLWQRPDLYIKSSPVFRADYVTTPLLLMHNPGDMDCDWDQGVEMYMALRRLGKKVWMLQYDHENHTVRGSKDAIDYTIRMNQFFDYYLKDTPPPKWMSKGIPAKLKGIELGYELDRDFKTF